MEPASTSGARPWGLRYATAPTARADVVGIRNRRRYDPALQVGVDECGVIVAGKHKGGTIETTGDSMDGQKPSPEETQSD